MAAVDLSVRARTPELMDTEPCDFATFRGCLRDLAWVNRLTLAYRPTLSFLDRVAAAGLLPRGRPLRILDVASGYGDMLRRIDGWGRRRNISLELTGLDLNPFAAAAAREATPEGAGITWRTGDVFTHCPEERVDLILSSLFAHHLDDVSLVRFLRWMEDEATLGWFVNDLHRHELPYRIFSQMARTLHLHRFVQNDGPISIARSFRPEDWQRFLAMAGIEPGEATVRRWMPFRLCVARVRSA